jgi:glycosyltransferase 2 family protein
MTLSQAAGRRTVRVTLTVALAAGCIAYLVWKVDLGETLHVLRRAQAAPLLAATAIWFAAVWPLAWRWQQLLRARGVNAPLGWLVRTYFVSYAAGQLLPTSLGGDAARIYSGSRRHRGETEAFVGSVLMERILGGIATLLLAAVGLGLAVGRFDIGPYVWIEGALVAATFAATIVLFSARMRRPLRRLVPLLRALRLERPARTFYEGLHAYRRDTRLLLEATTLTVLVQAVRILGIWLIGRSVGVHLSPRPYYVMGPLLFLVMLIPFTVSGLAVREAFFVSFLGQLGVGADAAFATGFLFFLLSVVLSVPGAVIVGLEALHRPPEEIALGGRTRRR